MISTRKRAALAACTLPLAVALVSATAPPAAAVRLQEFRLSTSSDTSSVLVYNAFSCKGVNDFVGRGRESEIDVGAVWLPRGIELWYGDKDGRLIRWFGAKKKAYCANFVSFPWPWPNAPFSTVRAFN